ncbi:MAG: NYN domain-containing protein [Eubacterium sp.]|nr:NYN domain-containing protein [Eubacterium sp.]
MSDKRIALLIDAENTSYHYIEDILKEINEYGTVTYKRMYGNFTDDSLKPWNDIAVKHAIVQIHQPRYSNAKNASDIMLVIDAMDILFDGKVEGFCIVSSDSDFTRLVNRLRESGMEVIGMGKGNASKALKAACTTFKNVEILKDNNSGDNETEIAEEDNKSKKADITPIEELIAYIEDIIGKNENAGKDTDLGEIGNRLIKAYSDFDVRNYGYKSLSTFVEDMKRFEVKKEGKSTYVTKAVIKVSKRDIEKFIRKQVEHEPMHLGALGQEVHNQFENFNVKDYGYSKFESFIKSLPGIEVKKKKLQKFVKKK